MIATMTGRRTACFWLSRLELTHDFHDSLHILHRSLRENAVAEVEYVAGTGSGALQKIRHVQLQLREGCKQDGWIQIALDRRAVADVHPRLVDVDAPVNSEHIAAGCMQLAEKAGSAGAEVNYRHSGRADALDHGSRI